ncbi:MAG TPA: hypothetical protein VIO11_08975 [Candidatus Methanoperedens sp.]
MENKIKYVMSAVAALIFMGAAYSLPAETFLAFFAGGLFLIPTSFFVYMLQSVAKE